jgi:hypothetical protein
MDREIWADEPSIDRLELALSIDQARANHPLRESG